MLPATAPPTAALPHTNTNNTLALLGKLESPRAFYICNYFSYRKLCKLYMPQAPQKLDMPLLGSVQGAVPLYTHPGQLSCGTGAPALWLLAFGFFLYLAEALPLWVGGAVWEWDAGSLFRNSSCHSLFHHLGEPLVGSGHSLFSAQVHPRPTLLLWND